MDLFMSSTKTGCWLLLSGHEVTEREYQGWGFQDASMFCFFMWLLNMCSVCEILLSFLLVTCTPFSKDIVFKLKVVNWREKTKNEVSAKC